MNSALGCGACKARMYADMVMWIFTRRKWTRTHTNATNNSPCACLASQQRGPIKGNPHTVLHFLLVCVSERISTAYWENATHLGFHAFMQCRHTAHIYAYITQMNSMVNLGIIPINSDILPTKITTLPAYVRSRKEKTNERSREGLVKVTCWWRRGQRRSLKRIRGGPIWEAMLLLLWKALLCWSRIRACLICYSDSSKAEGPVDGYITCARTEGGKVSGGFSRWRVLWTLAINNDKSLVNRSRFVFRYSF